MNHITDHITYSEHLEEHSRIAERYTKFIHHPAYDVSKHLYHINPLTFKSIPFVMALDLKNYQLNSKLIQNRRTRLPVNCSVVKYYDYNDNAYKVSYCDSTMCSNYEQFDVDYNISGHGFQIRNFLASNRDHISGWKRLELGIQLIALLRRSAGVLGISRVTDLHCPVDNKQYKRMDIEHVDGTFTSLDIISVNPLAQPFVNTGGGKTILDPHCPTSKGMGKWWPNENIYGTSLQVYSVNGMTQ